MNYKAYDTIIIGAGMSGIAAGIRLVMFDKKVCILEKHTIAGGLNSYYSRKGHLLDVGLHALTNYAEKKNRSLPLNKMFKQLRIPYEKFKLQNQIQSKIVFNNKELVFTNKIDDLVESVGKLFPENYREFENLLHFIEEYNELDLSREYISAKIKIRTMISSSELVEMLLSPLLVYGSAWENDMDLGQFVIMFKSIFNQGFCRPKGGVRRIIKTLLDRYNEVGGELCFKTQVDEIVEKDGCVSGVKLENGELLESDKVISSIGHPETMKLIANNKYHPIDNNGQMSFVESIFILKDDISHSDTIKFYNQNSDYYKYEKPTSIIDKKSAVICFPGNFQGEEENKKMVRITQIANYDEWKKLDKEKYKNAKTIARESALEILKRAYPGLKSEVTFEDIFTPLTIEKFTNRINGAVYGSTKKIKDGKTDIEGLFICGTDQGFLGIVGSLLSGISIANLHGLMES